MTSLITVSKVGPRLWPRVTPPWNSLWRNASTNLKAYVHPSVRESVEINELIEFDLGNSLTVRALHLNWIDRFSRKETVLPVPRTREQFGNDCPANINDCESVRLWTLGLDKGGEILEEK